MIIITTLTTARFSFYGH